LYLAGTMMEVYNMLKLQLKENKINVDIRTNNMNECKISLLRSKTQNHDELFGSQKMHTKTSKDMKTNSDPLMYSLMIMQDPTLSLLKPYATHKRVDHFKQEQLKNKLLSKEIKVLKPYKIPDVIRAIDDSNRTQEDCVMILSCIGEDRKLNICMNGKLAYCYDHHTDKYVDIFIDKQKTDVVYCEEGFHSIVVNTVLPNGLEKLKSTLVKDLKTYANILKIQGISKLTKQDLIDQITNTLQHHT